jgi:hypothetical protein
MRILLIGGNSCVKVTNSGIMLIPHQQARNLVIVDPRTGLQIPHVQGADPEMGYVIVPRTTYAPVPMIITEAGVSREVPYTFVIISSGDGSGRSYATWSCRCGFDIVNKHTGEVLHEVDGQPAPLEITDPAKYCQRHNPDNYEDPGVISAPPGVPLVPENTDRHSSHIRPDQPQEQGPVPDEPLIPAKGLVGQPGEDRHPEQVQAQDREKPVEQHQKPLPSTPLLSGFACPIWP